MKQKKEILELTSITKSYAGVTVLHNVDFSLNEGEIHCIVGENGAGKSTLIKILAGAVVPDYGEIKLFGQQCSYTSPQVPIDMGVATIYQDADLIESLTVADNVFLGDEKNRFGIVDRAQQIAQTKAIVDELELDPDPTVLVEKLSPGQKQLLQIVKALRRKARLIIMDEPTASLGEEATRMLMRTVKQLAASGIGIIYISHYLQDVFELADRITVIKNGAVTGCFQASKVTTEEIISAMVGREASLFFERERVAIGDEVIRVENMTSLPKVRQISFSVRAGEIFGLGGLVGSGRTELVRLIFGADRKQSGRVFIHGKEVSVQSPKQAVRAGICMLGEDRKQQGMFLQRSILENICISHNERKIVVLPAGDEKKTAEMIRKLNLKTTGSAQEIERLSGGNQQKCIIARWLLEDSEVYIFDEPTKGVDIGAREEIYKLMIELAKQGKAIIMVSSDMPELLSMSDRIGVLREGELVSIEDPKNLTEEDLISLYLGMSKEEKR